MLASVGRYRISSYINCLKGRFGDRKLVDSMAFLISASEGDDLEYFSPSGNYVRYYGKLEDVKGDCSKFVKIFSSYDGETIKSTAVKLWNYYAGKDVGFSDEETRLLSELGINV
jgi:hypothetical protein